jgi:hypothetical protein
MHKVVHGIDHPANLRRIGQFDDVIDSPQPQTPHGFPMALFASDHALDQPNFDFFHIHGNPF